MLCFRKKCINETEEFDFLKDIVAAVEDTPTAASSQADEVKTSSEHKNNLAEDVSVKESLDAALDEHSSNIQSHKCSISTILNDDPVTPPPYNRTSDVELSETNTSADNDLNEAL